MWHVKTNTSFASTVLEDAVSPIIQCGRWPIVLFYYFVTHNSQRRFFFHLNLKISISVSFEGTFDEVLWRFMKLLQFSDPTITEEKKNSKFKNSLSLFWQSFCFMALCQTSTMMKVAGRGISSVVGGTQNSRSLEQGSPTPVLEGPCPECLRCFPASAHWIQLNGSPSVCHPGLHRSVNDPFIWIRGAEAGNHLRHSGQDRGAPGLDLETPALGGPSDLWVAKVPSCHFKRKVTTLSITTTLRCLWGKVGLLAAPNQGHYNSLCNVVYFALRWHVKH